MVWGDERIVVEGVNALSIYWDFSYFLGKFEQKCGALTILCGGFRDSVRSAAQGKSTPYFGIFLDLLLEFYVVTFKLKLGVSDETGHVVVVMFDKTASELPRLRHAFYTRSVDDDSELPPALANIIRSTHTLELKSHTYSEHGTFESFTCWKLHSAETAEESACSSIIDAITETRRYSGKRLCRKPSVSTPLKPSKEKKRIREELEDSDARLSPPSAKGKKKKWLGPVAHLSHVPN
ncbi:hypothetical protein Tco_0179958 [Tanacetum coccineum]